MRKVSFAQYNQWSITEAQMKTSCFEKGKEEGSGSSREGGGGKDEG